MISKKIDACIKTLFVTCVLCAISVLGARGQEISFDDSIKAYNTQRLIVNAKGINKLALWGGLNAVAGGVGYFAANTGEWKYFHQMNFFWGAVNSGIAAFGAFQVRREARSTFSTKVSWERYRRDKKIYLINLGLDAIYIGSAAYLLQHAKDNPTDQQQKYKGFGRSILLQGLFLFTYDNLMLAAHQRNSDKWNSILDDMRFTGTSLTYNIRGKRTNNDIDVLYQLYRMDDELLLKANNNE